MVTKAQNHNSYTATGISMKKDLLWEVVYCYMPFIIIALKKLKKHPDFYLDVTELTTEDVVTLIKDRTKISQLRCDVTQSGTMKKPVYRVELWGPSTKPK